MTKKEAEIIANWLKAGSLVKATLTRSPDSNEFDLTLSKRDGDRDPEYVIIGIPLSVDESLN